MKILSPVDDASEVGPLLERGAAEFYGGFLTPEWERRFTLAASANRRSFAEAQIRGVEGLRATVEAVHAGGGRFFLTLNSPFYTAEQREILEGLIDSALEAGVDAFIAADVGLIARLRESRPGAAVHLSTLAGAASSPAAAFYRRLGVERVTLPRHLSLDRIRAVAAASRGTRFDVFVLYGQCVNEESVCTFLHDDPSRRWPCVQPWRITPRGAGRGEGEGSAAAGQAIWEGVPRGEACGLCALGELRAAGIESLKIVGRGTSLGRKEWAVSALSRLLEMIEGGASGVEVRAEARRLYRGRFPLGCRPTLCYFPELMDR